MRELLLDTLPSSAGQVLLWTLLGLAAGLAAGIALAFLYQRLGAFRLEWRHARWMRVLAALWILAAGLATGAVAGGCEGSLRGAQRAVADASFRSGPLLSAANAVSAGVAWIDLKLQGAPESALDDYVQGRKNLDVPGFYGRLGKAEADVVDGIVAGWNTQAQAKLGLSPSPMVDALLGAALRFVAQRVVRKTLQDKAKDVGVASAQDGFFAALEGGPTSHAEVAARLVDRCLTPLALAPVRFFVRGQQFTALLVGGLATLLPVLGFWIGRLLERRRPAP